MRKILIFLLLALPLLSFSQMPNYDRSRTFPVSADTIFLDTLSIRPSTLQVAFTNGYKLDSTQYRSDPVEAWIKLPKKFAGNVPVTDSIHVSYKVFPYYFTKTYYHKSLDSLQPDQKGIINPFLMTIDQKPEDDIFSLTTLNKNGSISRGITVGNNQDVAVNSSLNLRLSGQLTDKIDILAAITDNNIPIQPEGNTQQLQDFDQVYIQLSSDSTQLRAGDFQLRRPDSYFMNFYKRAQGLSVKHAFNLNQPTEPAVQPTNLRVQASGAISRGKFARNIIQGVESNQGPYRLRGNENELFIVVLAGTERVYIDGRLLTRGQENDYVIDYNTAEVTFTPKNLITKDTRIIVEFQYSDQNYARSLFHVGSELDHQKLKVKMNMYSEQDSKNQPLLIDLNQSQKELLGEIGDSLDLAVVPSYDTVAYNNDEVLYRQTDTVIYFNNGNDSLLFEDIFVYSTNPDSARFRVTFSDVGQGNGNYQQVSSSANGKVFQWIAPDTTTGEARGRFAPVQQLITPKQNQMFTLGVEYDIRQNSKLIVEGALSNQDLNRFSTEDSGDDIGYATRIIYDHEIPVGERDSTGKTKWQLLTGGKYEHKDQNFQPIERFRSVEFDRDWNLRDLKTQVDQHIAGVKLGTRRKNAGQLVYNFNTFLNGDIFRAYQNAISSNIDYKGFKADLDGSYIRSNGQERDNIYMRHRGTISQQVKWLVFGIRQDFENNRFFESEGDSLFQSSYFFNDLKYFITSPDTFKNKYSIHYQRRLERLPDANELARATLGESAGASLQLLKNPAHQFKTNVTYRRLHILDTLLTSQDPDNTLISRIEYNTRLLKGAVSSNTFYEVGSGLETKKEFSYLAVTNGEGPYIWNDYNDNNVKELNEFEINPFPNSTDTTYVRVFVPTNEFVKTFTNQFNEVLYINPGTVWGAKDGFKKFVSRFANQTVYRVDRKTNRTQDLSVFNPFISEVNDSILVTLNSSFRNSIFFNRTSGKVGLEYTYQDNRNKTLLTNGFETRTDQFNNIKSRWNMSRTFTLNLEYKDGQKTSTSEFFNVNNFIINYFEMEPKLVFQPNVSFRASADFNYSEKQNNEDFGGELTITRDVGTEVKYNILSKASILAEFNYISIAFNGEENSPLGFEMLEGLKTGKNFTWTLSNQTKLSKNMQLNLQYSGRKSEGNKAMHTGNVQVRAYF